MEENNTPLKRQREEEILGEVLKRQKSYKDIITLWEEEEDEPNQDLSSLIFTLQEELSTGPDSDQIGPYEPPSTAGSGGEEEEGEKLMRHLLEASDDELGIPNTNQGFDDVVGHVDGGDLFPVCDQGLWEFEDHEAANYYYNLLQSEIFL